MLINSHMYSEAVANTRVLLWGSQGISLGACKEFFPSNSTILSLNVVYMSDNALLVEERMIQCMQHVHVFT